MPDSFPALKGQQIKTEATIEYEIADITMPNGKSPVLTGKHAGKSNAKFLAAHLKSTSRRMAGKRARSQIDEQIIEEERAAERDLFAKHIIVGWKNVINSEGKESEFNYENCVAFLNALSEPIFEALANYFSNPSRFTNDALSPDELGEVGNGSGKSSGTE